MNKRTFLKKTGTLLAGCGISQIQAGPQRSDIRKNWAGNYRYQAKRLHTPGTLEEVQQIVRRSEKLKALGARHSFNGIADSPGDQISLKNFDRMELDREARTVTVGAGVTYGGLALFLDEKGYAVHNLASLPHVSVVGACATATHGSGDRCGNLSTAVASLEFVAGTGERVRLSREKDGDRFRGAVVALGGLGIVTEATLAVEPSFTMRQYVYRNLPMGELEKNFDQIFSSAYSVCLFTDWQDHRINQVWRKERGSQAKAPAEFFGAKLATKKLHPLEDHSAENCTDQMGIEGPWYERLPHFRMNFTPSSGEELQAEYFVPRSKGYQAILAIEQLKSEIEPHLFISELRTIAADELWMSPAYKRDSLAIHFTWKPHAAAVQNLLPKIEQQLEPFEPRPHWAKLFTMSPGKLQSRYEKLDEFKALLTRYDPQGKLHNAYLSDSLLA